jgi:F-type H+-transporting ATPase subunit b
LTSPRPCLRFPRYGATGATAGCTSAGLMADFTQETAKLEAQAYELEQKTAIAHEAKTVLDSWVRYEGQVKQRQQRELAESIISKIEKELENPKTLKQILDQSVTDVERIVSQKA